MSDARKRAARYRADAAGEEEPERPDLPEDPLERAAFVETAIQLAIRRGDFDDLPGAGKPLVDLGAAHDPDWWIRRKIERENLTGIGPAAFLLRTEDRTLNERLDRLHREDEVRAELADFTKRVIEARRQLLGGPPVVTPLRDVDAEVTAWSQRRAARTAAALARAEAEPARRRRWWSRRR
ncbi:DUF1992 domain-containing protein [Rathayibacter rathayi]|uniref:DUF1992 domain-containing protein n=1 Tax=Rathayibacter rathayi TaxID=33887 RepID=A0ABX5ACB5_RATRA|nr:DUF1992 domain-containing protein [Rathayibacter rathayi]AZZ49487.1 DUF1992 domain-containing protein [Rathayibacter rathayi]MWV73598.1 DUF1992 domain-containing protein [Rathayibacter rathayi NCPPB 2980 = VKM Ac-1601]PPF47816.1 DUF1992 domain-containing protein [Rathayibacter rathayi]PPG67006.1 DUF1992 domain-containing protein [Rathayibacter rathayi]PPG76361.1 DUF1992 domain-containing protein [Rathayibacter rathayi]